jgi:hypothetical protein
MGSDFSQVRIHDDAWAAETAKSINAKAFTTGRDVIFGTGQYTPKNGKGLKLIAHELTHVIQQDSSKKFYRAQLKAEDGEQPKRIWDRDPFAKWGQRGNRGVSWGNDGRIPKKYHSDVKKAFDLVYGLGKNKQFLKKFHHTVSTITKGKASQIRDI